MCFMLKQPYRLWIDFIISFIGVLFGVSAFVAFFCIYKNYEAGVWGILSGVIAAVVLHLHYLHVRHKLESWHSVETLEGTKVLGVFSVVIGLACLTWYIFKTSYYHIPILPVEESVAITAVWTFMFSKWGFLLIIFSNRYIDILLRKNHLLEHT